MSPPMDKFTIEINKLLRIELVWRNLLNTRYPWLADDWHLINMYISIDTPSTVGR